MNASLGLHATGARRKRVQYPHTPRARLGLVDHSARNTIVASGGKTSEAECGQPWLAIASV
ncbi:hypothetical protein B0G69_3960 [Paraburkholderia sp. RAU2J]|nr:hypothetical protein B0G69_3960 [Paraburkholderia sp. RAU2J]